MNKSKYILIGILIGIPSVLVLGAIWFSWGMRSGVEFSPDDFTRRSFSYNKDPLFGFVFVGREYVTRTTDLETELISDGWIKPLIRTKKQWHLVSDSRSNSELVSSDCDARFLTNYLDRTNSDFENIWTVWNRDHPKLAKVFWPVVAEMARDEMYLLLPDLMQFADNYNSKDTNAFQSAINDIRTNSYRKLGELDFELGRIARAKYRLAKAKTASPDTELDALIEKCNEQLNRGSSNDPAADDSEPVQR